MPCAGGHERLGRGPLRHVSEASFKRVLGVALVIVGVLLLRS